MSRFRFGKGPQDPHADAAVAPEDPVVRQYRYLLRTAPVDALEAAHLEAIPLLSEADQEALVASLRSSFLVGDHLTAHDHVKIAHLVTSGERRSRGQLLMGLPPDTLQNLAARVLRSESCFGLFGGYAYWDGAEPQPEDDALWADGGFDPKLGRWAASSDPRVAYGLDGEGIGGNH